MKEPINPLVAEMVSKLNPALREEFEERAAIMEFEGKLSRDHAECLALLDVLHRHTDISLIHPRTANAMKKYLGKLYERNGEFEYVHPMLFEAIGDPWPELTQMAKNFYPGQADEQDDGFYFFCGGIYIKPDFVAEVTDEEYAVLGKFI